MKLNKKELQSIAQTYKYWKLQENTQDFFEGMKMTLVTIGVLKQVENEIFKQDHIRSKNQIETTEQLIKKAYGKNYVFDSKKLDYYKDDIQFMEKLTEEEKNVLQANISYIENYS